MTIFVGLALVLGAIAAGFILEKGQLLVLLQPSELIMIGGAAVGIIVISNPWRNLKKLCQSVGTAFHHSPYSADFYLDVLKVLYVLSSWAQRRGYGVLEPHVEKPESSEIFASHPGLARDPAALTFLCDSVRMVTATGIDPEELDRIMAIDVEVQRAGRQQSVGALLHVADSLPGLGIVAAVLGVVVTMQSLGGPAGEIGQKVAAALVGTFLGILLCYGIVSPVATNVQNRNRAKVEVLHVLRTGLVASLRGVSPMVAAEYARRSIPQELRPSYDLMENELRRNTRLPSVRTDSK
jgi:chemotaxis protein MotA